MHLHRLHLKVEHGHACMTTENKMLMNKSAKNLIFSKYLSPILHLQCTLVYKYKYKTFKNYVSVVRQNILMKGTIFENKS